MPRPAARLIPLLLASSLALVGCGSETGQSADPTVAVQSESPSNDGGPTASPSASKSTTPDWPTCASVWKGGATLKRSYQGCLAGGEPVKADKILCSFGTPIVTYAHRFYAEPGHEIHDEGSLKKSAEFQHDLSVCTG